MTYWRGGGKGKTEEMRAKVKIEAQVYT